MLTPEEQKSRRRAASAACHRRKREAKHPIVQIPVGFNPTTACEQGICLWCMRSNYECLDEHIRRTHCRDVNDYRAELDIPSDVKIRSGKFRNKVAAQLLGTSRPETVGKTGPKSPGRYLPLWSLARDITKGAGMREARGLRTHALTQRRLIAMGLTAGGTATYDQGEALRRKQVKHFLKASGLVARELAEQTFLKKRWFHRRTEKLVNPKTAYQFISWRDALVSELVKMKILTAPAVIKTLFPGIAGLKISLIETFSKLRPGLREKPEKTVEEFCNDVCVFACQVNDPQLEHFRRTLRFLWQAEPFLDRTLNDLRGPKKVFLIVHELLGATHGGVGQKTIRKAVQANARTLLPTELWGPIQLALKVPRVASAVGIDQKSLAVAKKKAGRPPGHTPEVEQRIATAAKLTAQGKTKYQMVEDLFPDQAKTNFPYAYKLTLNFCRTFGNRIAAAQSN